MGRWVKETSERWRSTENKDITVHVNEEEDTMEGDGVHEDEYGTMYLVFPAFKNKGMPSSPATYSQFNYGSVEEARKKALKKAKEIMKLSIKKIERFKWNMIR